MTLCWPKRFSLREGLPRFQDCMFNIAALRREWLSNPRRDLPEGIVVALALIREATGFSVTAGLAISAATAAGAASDRSVGSGFVDRSPLRESR